LEATLDRPLLGWGPGNTWSAYLTHASAHDVELAQRGIDDPHDLLLGALVTSGLLGFVAFLGLIVLVVIRARRAPPALGWAVGVAGALFVFHLLQPVSF